MSTNKQQKSIQNTCGIPKWTSLWRHTDGQPTHEMSFNTSHYHRNANENFSEVLPHKVRMAINKNSTSSKCWRGCVGKGTLLHSWWKSKVIHPPRREVCRALKKMRIKILYDPASPRGTYPDKTMIQSDSWARCCLEHHLWKLDMEAI